MPNPNAGDLIEISTTTETVKGFYIPSPNKDIIILKLGSGYNIGINKKKIKKIKIIKKYKPIKRKKSEKISQKKSLLTISILGTGGTLACKVDYKTGGVIPTFSPEEILEMIPEIKKVANIKSRLISNMWSQDMRFSHYNLMAKEIAKEAKKGVDGIIITHGTDTIHFTSAALSFILEDLNIPVVIVGSQRSSDRGSSDASSNLICACHFIAKMKDFADVGVCMHASIGDEKCHILPGCKCRKLHTSRRDAFKAVNTQPWAEITYPEGHVHLINPNFRRKNSQNKLKLKLFKENLKVGIIKAHTNMYSEQFSPYKNFKGLVIEATGIGNIPSDKIDKYTNEHTKIFNIIKLLIKKGVIVALAPQTIYGRLNLNVYENQRKMKEIGVIGDLSDMTTETTFIKLAWLLSNYPKQAKQLMTENLRGELNQKSH